MLVIAPSACADRRTATDAKGDVPFAPVRTDLNADADTGPPHFPPFVPVPAKGFVDEQESFGYVTDYVFDAATGELTGVWIAPPLPGTGAAPPEIHHIALPKDERLAVIRLANLAYGARHRASGQESPHQVAKTVWLLDDPHAKRIDGYRAGAAIDASVAALAQKHGIVPDNYEK